MWSPGSPGRKRGFLKGNYSTTTVATAVALRVWRRLCAPPRSLHSSSSSASVYEVRTPGRLAHRGRVIPSRRPQ